MNSIDLIVKSNVKILERRSFFPSIFRTGSVVGRTGVTGTRNRHYSNVMWSMLYACVHRYWITRNFEPEKVSVLNACGRFNETDVRGAFV